MYVSIPLLHICIIVLSAEAAFVAQHSAKWTPCPNKGIVLSNHEPYPHFDWRECGGVSPVKDQERCADCWAFSAVANIESQYWRQGMQFILSEQFLLDCNTMGADCSNNGTGVVNTFADIITKLGGVPQVQDYRKYNATKVSCQWDSKHELVNVAGMVRVRPGDEAGMTEALVKHGPLSAGINDAMMAVSNRDPLGIDDPTPEQCPPNQRNHAVLIVGYSSAQSSDGKWIPYWILKNSWGEDNGDHGFYYLRRGTNACGIAMDVSYATV